VREAKGRVISAWTRAHPRGQPRKVAQAILSGQFRAPDPWYQLTRRIVRRRLAPNARKIEFTDAPGLVTPQLLQAMGYELANIHRGTRGEKGIAKDLAARSDSWLRRAAQTAAQFVSDEYRSFSGRPRR
jgi:hypothetical protein